MSLASRFSDRRVLRHPLLFLLLLVGLFLLLLSLLPGGGKWLQRSVEIVTPAPFAVTGVIASDKGVQLRWNALVNPWRHPREELTFETELRLYLALRNTGGREVRVEAMRILSQQQERKLTWEALWRAEAVTWERTQPIEPQIQQHRQRLEGFVLAPDDRPLPMIVDFAPVDHARPLPQGSYQNLLQIKTLSSDDWVDVLRFGFTIPESFQLEDSQGYRYQYWQVFALEPSL